MITPFHEYPRTKRKARRKGRSHGRQGLPNSDWSGGPVPYLEGLHAIYSQKIESLQQSLRITEGQSITSEEEDIADKHSQEYLIAQTEQERAAYENQLNNLLLVKTGLENENPTGKAARNRHIPIWLYSIALFTLGLGEYFVTLPAVEILLNDEGLRAYLITTSFSALSILAAHLIGLTLKIDIDRDQPQPSGQKWGASLIGLGLTFVVLFLSAIRSKGINSVPVTFGMSDKVFGTVLFFLIQITFILCAIGLSYYNHSEIESEISRTKRQIRRLTSKIRSLTRSRLIPSRGNLTPEKREVQVNAIYTHMRLFEAEYRELCAIYRGANLLSQKVSFNSPGAGLTENSLQLPNDLLTEVN